MTLQQLRLLCEIVKRGLTVSGAARALYTSQPAASKQMKQLEEELGAALFVKRQKRIVGLTRFGHAVLAHARVSVDAADNVLRAGKDAGSADTGDLTVATTHTYARYVLPATVSAFLHRYPKVRLSLRQGNPHQIAEWVASGEFDFGISGRPLVPFTELMRFQCYEYDRIVLASEGHPFLKEKRVTLETIARYPMITYDPSFTGRAQIANAFAEKGLKPHIALSATDADVMKVYVKLGLGIAIVSEKVYDPDEDRGLKSVNVHHLLPPNKVSVVVRRGIRLRSYAYSFIELFAPELKREVIEQAAVRAQAH